MSLFFHISSCSDFVHPSLFFLLDLYHIRLKRETVLFFWGRGVGVGGGGMSVSSPGILGAKCQSLMRILTLLKCRIEHWEDSTLTFRAAKRGHID